MLTVLFLMGVMYDYRAPLQNKVDPRCYTDTHVRAWVYFTDKNVTVEQYDAAVMAARRTLTDEALQRRALRRGVTDYADIPVYEDYVAEVEANGGLLITRSKWLNAASAAMVAASWKLPRAVTRPVTVPRISGCPAALK